MSMCVFLYISMNQLAGVPDRGDDINRSLVDLLRALLQEGKEMKREW